MHETAAVGVLQRQQQLHDHSRRHRTVKRTALQQQLGGVRPVNVLHREIQQAAGLADLQAADNVRMVELFEHSRFAQEAFHLLLVDVGRRQHRLQQPSARRRPVPPGRQCPCRRVPTRPGDGIRARRAARTRRRWLKQPCRVNRRQRGADRPWLGGPDGGAGRRRVIASVPPPAPPPLAWACRLGRRSGCADWCAPP